jgi:hypothetical protein
MAWACCRPARASRATNDVPISGWKLTLSGDTGGPDSESGVAAAILYCRWTRAVSRETSSGALFEVVWKCIDPLPCGIVGNVYYKSSWEWRKRRTLTTYLESTTTRLLIMGADSEFLDEYECLKGPRPGP